MLTEKLNFTESSSQAPAEAIEIKKGEVTTKTLIEYCNENGVDLTGVSAEEIAAAVDLMVMFGQNDIEMEGFYFWID
jgi:hypothetical protein